MLRKWFPWHTMTMHIPVAVDTCLPVEIAPVIEEFSVIQRFVGHIGPVHAGRSRAVRRSSSCKGSS